MILPKLLNVLVAVLTSCLVGDGDGDAVLLCDGGDGGYEVVDGVLPVPTSACLLPRPGRKRNYDKHCCLVFYA